MPETPPGNLVNRVIGSMGGFKAVVLLKTCGVSDDPRYQITAVLGDLRVTIWCQEWNCG